MFNLIAPARFARAVLAFAGGLGLLMLVWLALPVVGQASPELGADQQSSAQSPAPAPDPRWLALVHVRQNLQSVSLQSASPSINVNLTDGFVAGHVSSLAMVVISVTRGAERVAYATAPPALDSGGYFYLAYPWITPYGSESGDFQVDDVVWVAQAGAVVSLTIPTLSGLAAPESDTLYGAGPANESVTTYLFPFDAPNTIYTQTASVDANGSYAVVVSPAVDLRPRDTGYVIYAANPDRQVYARFVAPFLIVQADGPAVSGMAAPNSGVEITVTDSSGLVVANLSAYTRKDGWFDLDSYYGGSGWAAIRPTNRITAAAAWQTFAMTVLTVTAHSDRANGQVLGEAPAGQSVELLNFKGPILSLDDYYYSDESLWDETPAARIVVTATGAGNYTATLPLNPADYGAAIVTSPEGHQTYARFAVPYLWIRLGDDRTFDKGGYYPPWLWGQLDAALTPVTLTIQGPSGYLKGQRQFTTGGSGYFMAYVDYPELITLDSGDVLTLTTPRGAQLAYTLPLLTAEADPASSIVSGMAPPNAPLAITLSNYYWPPNSATLVVTATAQGQYMADFSSLGGFPRYPSGQVQYTTPEGYTIVRVFRLPPLTCQPTFEGAQIGGNLISFSRGISNCPDATIRLRDAQGQLKAETTMLPGVSYLNWALYDPIGRPISIEPGDQIEIRPGSWTAMPAPFQTSQSASSISAITVPTLTAVLDPAANTVTGRATPGAVLSLALVAGPYKSYFNLTTTVSAQGFYTANLTGVHMLLPGDRVQVSAPANFYAYGILPMVRAQLYQSGLEGLLPPLTPYSLTISSDSRVITTYASTDGSFFASSPALKSGDSVTITTPERTLRMTLAALTARLDWATKTVTGQAPPNSRLKVTLGPIYYGWEGSSQIVTATAMGAYTATFSSPFVSPYTDGSVTHFDAAGNQTILNFSAPRWNVTLGSNCLSGFAEMPGQTVVTLYAQETLTLTASLDGSLSLCFQRPIEPGDQLIRITSAGVTTYTVPLVTAQHDYRRGALEGLALPNSVVQAHFGPEPYGYASLTRSVTADANGHYGMDTNDLGLLIGQNGAVVVTDAEGNTVRAGFTISGYQVYLPLTSKAP